MWRLGAAVFAWMCVPRFFAIGSVESRSEPKSLARRWIAQPRPAAAIVAFAISVGSCSVGATAPPLGFTLVEQLSVPIDGTAAVSDTVLNTGVTYILRASGTLTLGGPAPDVADAEYFNETNDFCIFGGASTCDYGIKIDEPIVGGGRKQPFWGPFNPTHEYMIEYEGRGAPLAFRYHDDIYGDNSGSPTVEIFAPISTNLRLTRSTMNNGGEMSWSGNYRLEASLGQELTVGTSSSPNSVLQSGFWSFLGSGLVPVILTEDKPHFGARKPDLFWSGNNAPYDVYESTDCTSVFDGPILASTFDNAYLDIEPDEQLLVCYRILATAPGKVPDFELVPTTGVIAP